MTRFAHFKLQPDLELKCKIVVNNILGNSPEEIKRKCAENEFEFSLIVIPNIYGPDKTRNFISFHSKSNSHVAVVNEYISFFNFRNAKEIKEMISELNFRIDVVSEMSIYYLTRDEREIMIKTHFKALTDLKIKFLVEAFKHQFFQKLKTQTTPHAISSFVKELVFDESVSLAKKYSNDRVQSIINKHLEIV